MDSKEFSLKMDRLKKLVDEKDYATALKIVEGIDWNRVKSANLLSLASSVYEENGMLEEAKDTLVIALERSSGGKRILYKLTELAVCSGDVEEATEYYQEYAAVAPDDPSCLILQYMILKVKHAPYTQLIKCLELYNEYEPDEKWMYELATTYESAGRIQDAVALCDRIALMFGNSPYVVKALKLKQKYVKLSDDQRASLYPNSIANAGVHYAKNEPEYVVTKTVREPVVIEERLGDRLSRNRIENEDELFETYLKEHDPLRGQDVPEEKPIVPQERFLDTDGPVAVDRAPEPEEDFGEGDQEPEPERKAIPVERAGINEGFLTEPEEYPEETESEASSGKTVYRETEAPREPSAPAVPAASVLAAELTAEKDPDAELLRADARLADARLSRTEEETEPAKPQLQARTSFTVSKPEEEPVDPEEAEEPVREENVPGIHLIIEALEEEEGVAIAGKELAAVYQRRGKSRSVAKATAEKLNRIGDMSAMASRIGERDLVIVQAGDLEEDVADQLFELLEGDSSERSFILVDTPEGLDMLEDKLPEFFDICDILTDVDAREKDYSVPREPEKAPVREEEPVEREKLRASEPEEEEPEEDREEEPARQPKNKKNGRNGLLENSGNIPFRMPKSDSEIMESEDFAQYCIHYANEKGCSISGKTLLALYEKIEIMEEDGIALTKIAAEDCVEEAADHAEHPGLKGLFREKYDKDDMLILREEDFIN